MMNRRSLHYLLLITLATSSAMAQEWEPLVSQSDSLAGAGNVDSAIVVMELALARHGTEWTPSDTAFASSLFHLSAIAFNNFRYKEALSYSSLSITIREKFSDPLDPMLARALNVKGITCWALGEVGKASAIFEGALKLWRQSPAPDSLQMLKTIVNYASVCNAQDRFELSMSYFRKALAICDKRPDLAKQYRTIAENNMTNVYFSLHQYAEAAKGFEKQLAALEKEVPPDTSTLSGCLQNLAQAYVGLGRYAEAADRLDRARNLEAASQGEDTPDFAFLLSKQAELDLQMGKLYDARLKCERSLKIREQSLGPNHPGQAETLMLYAKKHPYNKYTKQNLKVCGRACQRP